MAPSIAGTLVACSACTVLLLVAAPAAHAQVDLEAERAYLRTDLNTGDEIAVPRLDQQVYVHIDYRVTGSGSDFEAEVRALIDGEQHCAGPITFTPGQSSAIWCRNAWTATAGTHTLRWEIDSGNAVAETDEGNNAAQVTFTTDLDLEAERAYLRTDLNAGDEITSPEPGQQTYVHLDYRTTGSGDGFEAGVRALIDGEEHCAGPITFTPGESSVIWCQNAWTATAGAHTLRWEIDPDNAVAETDEDNNVAEIAFGCAGDCNGDGQVQINELVLGVSIALGNQVIGQCPAFDQNGNGQVAINELVAAVGNALNGCS